MLRIAKYNLKLIVIILLTIGLYLLPQTAAAETSSCSLEKFLPTTEECWFCPMFSVIFNTASTIALKSYTALASGVANLVIVCFALWICLFVLRHVASLETKDPRKMIQEFLLQAFRVLVIVLILKVNYFQIIGLTLEPVFNTGLTVAQTITGSGNNCSNNAQYMQNIVGYDSNSGFTNSASGGLPASMGQSIVCTIKTIQDSISRMKAYGSQAWCVGWREKAIIKNFIPSFPFLITGAVIYIGALLLLVAFPWCLIDAVLQMSIAAGLAPAAIGAWAFKITAGYLKKIWDFFMNAMFNFVFLSIIIYIIMTVVDQFMNRLDQDAAKTGLDFLIDPINGLAYWGVTGMKLVVVCLMGWVFLDEGKSFANHFAKGAEMGDIGRHVGGAIAQGAQRVGKTAAKVGKAVGSASAQMADHFIGSRIRKARNNYRINRVKENGKALFDANGNVVGYEKTSRNLLGQKVTRQVSVGADGKELWSKNKLSLRSELRNKARNSANQWRLNKMMKKGKQILDNNGNVVGYEMEHRNALGQKVKITAMKNADGTFDFNKEKNSLRMEILAKISKPGSAVNNFARKNSVFKKKSLNKVNNGGQSISSDHLMSVRERRDSNGNVIQRDIAFNTKTVKHLVNKDGTLNMNMVNQIMHGSHFDQNTVKEALAMEVLKARGISVGNKFANRQISFDKNGVMHLKQQNVDGSVTELNMAIGGKNKNQMLTELKTTFADGSYSVNVDNGIMKKNINYRNGDASATVSYGFNDIYYRRYKHFKPLNSMGQFAFGMDEDVAMFGFSDADKDAHTQQVYSGKPQTTTAYYTSIF